MRNPIRFVANVRQCASLCRDVPSVFERLAWLYSRSRTGAPPRRRLLRLRYPAPVGAIDLIVRDNDGADNFIIGEVFHHEYYQTHPSVSDVQSIVDLGAHAGFTTLYWTRHHPKAKIVAVEPHPDNASLLRSNCLLNNVHADVVEAACVSDDRRSVRLATHPNGFGHQVDTGAHTAATHVTVAGISMPALLETNRLKEISILKIDIEGYERTLLHDNAEWLACVRAIVVEWHFPDAAHDLTRIAAQHGFRPPQQHRGQYWLVRP